MIDKNTKVNSKEGEVYFYNGDHLGSANWITDSTGAPIQYIHYAPYGELIANQQMIGYDERYKFTGKERDAETGYDYFGARFYDHRKGFWNSVDPLADKYPNVTPYLYCNGNPIMLVDPDGREPSTKEAAWMAEYSLYSKLYKMKRKFIYLIYILIVVGTLQSCIKYERLTHLSENDLEWVTNRHIGEVMYFQSQNGNRDTIKVWNITIHNSTDPINWNYLQTGGTEYIANACVELVINHYTGVKGNFYIIKKSNDEPIYFSTGFFMRWTQNDMPLSTINMKIRDIIMDDFMFFDDSLLGPVNEYSPSNPIVSFAWSKQYGLVQYTFQDGTEFNRIDLE